MKLDIFLLENVIDIEDGKQSVFHNDFIKEYYSHYSDWPLDTPLYRYDSGLFGYGTKDGGRLRLKVLGGQSLFQDYLGNLVSWKNIPKRKNSIFTSTKKTGTYIKLMGKRGSNENLFCIIPKNGSTISVLNSNVDDFNSLLIHADGDGHHITDIDDDYVESVVSDLKTSHHELRDKSVEHILVNFQKYYNEGLISEKSVFDADTFKSILFWFNEENVTPEKLKVEIVTPKTYPESLSDSSNEVWFSDDYMYIPVDKYNDFKNSLK